MLHVQAKRGIGESPSSSLRCGLRSVKCSFYSFWFVFGYAYESLLLVCLLMDVWKAEECCNLEDGADLPSLVCLKGNK